MARFHSDCASLGAGQGLPRSAVSGGICYPQYDGLFLLHDKIPLKFSSPDCSEYLMYGIPQ